MEMKLEFTYSGRSLEARADIQSKGVTVEVFEGSDRVTNRKYIATLDTVKEAQKYPYFERFIESMLEFAKGDIEEGVVKLDSK